MPISKREMEVGLGDLYGCWSGPVQELLAWEIAFAPIAHATGAAGLVCALAVGSLSGLYALVARRRAKPNPARPASSNA